MKQDQRQQHKPVATVADLPAEPRYIPAKTSPRPMLARHKALNINWQDPVDWVVIGAGLVLLALAAILIYQFSHDVSQVLLAQFG